MKQTNNFILYITILFFLLFCFNNNKLIGQTNKTKDNIEIKHSIKKLISQKENLIKEYKASKTKINDLINTKLYLSFNYKKKQVFGKAEIKLKPHFYPTDSLILDAQSFIIKNIEVLKNNKLFKLNYTYNNYKMRIKLDKQYTKNDTLTVVVNYIAEPTKIKKSSSWAIHDNRGLYFINADSENPQIWSQGETQSNSAWFPTIDAPNQKMSQEIFLTVYNKFKTLSNGKLISSTHNIDGTRTDYWKQTKPHAPYLAMIAIGKFNVIKLKSWNNLPINLYVEDGQEEKATALFKDTYQMIDLFSKKIKYDFPWDKYSQIVVRKFVSGAMENTGAVVFGDFTLKYKNEERRIENETIVAHELSHHWFGDLITCESWANLPLNESFATYFEYIWLEYKYGRTYADKHLANDYLSYKFEHLFKDKNLIRFYNKHRDDMFDAHSYQKGGLILHMLRYTVGDDAFFDALHLYLKTNEYKSVEIHNLRLAFEEVTGEDLNWFFNQWFLNKGIPELNINYSYSKKNKNAIVKIEQTQNLEKSPLYKIPTYIDFYFKDKTIRKKFEINEQTETFKFSFNEKPLAVNFDPNNSILYKKTENYTTENYITILDKAPLYNDKNEALKHLSSHSSIQLNKVYLKLCKNDYWHFRYEAISRLNPSDTDNWTEDVKTEYINLLKNISKNDSNLRVRTLAQNKLNKYLNK